MRCRFFGPPGASDAVRGATTDSPARREVHDDQLGFGLLHELRPLSFRFYELDHCFAACVFVVQDCLLWEGPDLWSGVLVLVCNGSWLRVGLRAESQNIS